VVSNFGLPSRLSFAAGGAGICGGGAQSEATTRHIVGPGTPPLGTGSLAVSLGARSSADLTYQLPSDTAADLTALSAAVYGYAPASGGPMQIQLSIYEPITDSPGSTYRLFDRLGQGSAAFGANNILADPNLVWFRDDSGGTETQLGTGSYSGFLANPTVIAHPATLDYLDFFFDNCGNTGPNEIAMDNLTLGVQHNNTTYDFEPPSPTTLTSHLPVRLVAGHRFAPSVTVAVPTITTSNFPVALWAKTGHTAYREVATTTTDSAGVATAPAQKPSVTTTYQWRFAADDTYAAGVSRPVTVKVAPRLTLFFVKRAVAAGRPVQASGTASLRHAGSAVTLWRTKHHKMIKLARGTERHGGFYSITKVLAPGDYRLFVTVAKDGTNARGISPTRSVTVAKHG
jgi:hypothetical protein